ncbi:MAG: sensor domain-containing protein [Acidimicrobiales bacterium]
MRVAPDGRLPGAGLEGGARRRDDGADAPSSAHGRAPDLFALLSPDGTVLRVNDAAAAALGLGREAVEGTAARDYAQPDDQERIDAVIDDIAGGRPLPETTFTARLRHVDGTLHVLDLTWADLRDVPGMEAVLVIGCDVTEQARLAQKLERREEYFQSVFRHSSDLIVVLDHTARCRFASHAADLITGWPSHALVGRNLGRLIWHNQRETISRLWGDIAARPGTHPPHRIVTRHRNGSDLVLEVVATNLLDDPIVDGVIVTCRDISDRVRAEEATHRLAELMAQSNDAIIGFDLEGRITAWNAGAQRSYGYRAEEVMGQHASVLSFPGTEYDFEALLARVRAGGPLHYESVRRRKDGSAVHLAVALSPVRDASGTVVGLSGIGRDMTDQVRARSAHQRLAALAEASSDAIIGATLDGTITSWNRGAERLLGYSAADIVGERASRLAPGATGDELIREWAAPADGASRYYEAPLVRKDGSDVEVAVTVSPVHNEVDRVVAVSAVARDISDQKRAERELRSRTAQQEALARLSAQALAGAKLEELYAEAVKMVATTLVLDAAQVLELDPPDRRIVQVAAYGWPVHDGRLEYPDEEIAGWRDLVLAQREPFVVDDLRTETRFTVSEKARSTEVVSVASARIEGSSELPLGLVSAMSFSPRRFSDDDLTFLQAAANVIGVAIERRRVADEMRHLALHDALTGLPNRALMMERLKVAVRRLRRRPGAAALLFIDLDHFKRVNDTLGHSVGDTLLVESGRRLRAAARDTDVVARLGGDEFTVLLEDVAGAEQAFDIAGRLAVALSKPMRAGSHEVVLTASIGVALTGDHAADPEDLLRDADLAMYRAKDLGRNRCELFDEKMRLTVEARLAIEEALRRALPAGELSVVFQPQLSIQGEQVLGVEALLRWHHQKLGAVAPGRFMPVAEDSGLVTAIGTKVVTDACRVVADLRQRWPHMRVAVNFSPRQLHDPGVRDLVFGALDEQGLETGALTLEITESVLLDDDKQAREAIAALRARGVQVSIDDFGTGYSSLAYLTRVPVDEVKIDRAFVAGLGRVRSASAIVEAVVAMAHALELRVVAEGVERAEQVKLLAELGCDAAQGYYWSRPRTPRGLVRWLRART